MINCVSSTLPVPVMYLSFQMRSPSEPTYPDMRPWESFGYCREATKLEKRHQTRSYEEAERSNFLSTVTTC
jgi:hypothetical protein